MLYALHKKKRWPLLSTGRMYCFSTISFNHIISAPVDLFFRWRYEFYSFVMTDCVYSYLYVQAEYIMEIQVLRLHVRMCPAKILANLMKQALLMK
jgi:hypothetical protein